MYSVYLVCLGLVLVNYITSCMYVHSSTSICSPPINLKVVSISICEHRTAKTYRRVLRQVSCGLGRNIYQMLCSGEGGGRVSYISCHYGGGNYTLIHPCIKFQGSGHPRARFSSSLWSRQGTGFKTLWDGMGWPGLAQPVVLVAASQITPKDCWLSIQYTVQSSFDSLCRRQAYHYLTSP